MQGTSSRYVVEPGSVVGGRYRLGALLGSGGMADVYDALDLRLERAVAVKVLRPEMALRDDVRLRFQVEARAAAGLTHPNAVAVFDTGEHEGLPYLVMERLPGDSLAEYLAEGPIDTDWLREAAVGVLGALAAAHEAGIVHRDVKPGNILLTSDGRAKITDFGIAKSLGTGGDKSDLTQTGQLVGTPAYLAPERLEGHLATPRSDLFALGVVLYEAFAGRKPFQGDSPLAVARAVAEGDHVPLGDVRPDLDPVLVATVERAMARDPEERFASAEEMAGALAARPADPTLGGPPAGTVVMPAEAVVPRSVAWRAMGRDLLGRRGLALLVAGASFLLLLLFLLARSDGSPSPARSAETVSTTAPAQAVSTTAPARAESTTPPAQAVSTTAPAPAQPVVSAPPSGSSSVTVTVPPAATGSLTVVATDNDDGGGGGGDGDDRGGGKGKGKGKD